MLVDPQVMENDAFQSSPLAKVECRATDDGWTLVFVRDLSHPPEKVWRALTDPAQLRQWAPYTADRDLGSPGGIVLTMIDEEGAEELASMVIHAERPTLLEYSMGTDLLRWELTATSSGARLVLQHTVKERDWAPKAAAGWHLCLDVAERLLD
ncbi:SRPBCC family protein, partial [Actinomadura miaoliensis]|uniref:SRPBCC family protein n=1 Tax=Actinomadura miaoliensis TaxID=430685 RepID=UPI0031E78BEB